MFWSNDIGWTSNLDDAYVAKEIEDPELIKACMNAIYVLKPNYKEE